MAEKGFAFAFVEGALVKAVREGWWLLLDEINLAPAEVCLLLPSVAFCCLLLPSVAFCCLLLPSDLHHMPFACSFDQTCHTSLTVHRPHPHISMSGSGQLSIPCPTCRNQT